MLRGFRLGLIPLEGEGPHERTRAFADALATAVGAPVLIHHAAGYRALVTALAQELVHFAWLPPLSAARAVREKSIAPVAVVSRSGSTSYMTALIAKKGERVRQLSDLRGASVAWVDRESASGYLVIRAALSKLGVSLVDAFGEELFVRTHAEVARAVHTGRVDVGATCFNFIPPPGQPADAKRVAFNIARSGYAGEAGLPIEEVEMIAHAGPIPSDIFAVHANVPPPAMKAVQSMLLDARPAAGYELARAVMHADSFARVTSSHVAMLDLLWNDVVARQSSIPPRGP